MELLSHPRNSLELCNLLQTRGYGTAIRAQPILPLTQGDLNQKTGCNVEGYVDINIIKTENSESRSV